MKKLFFLVLILCTFCLALDPDQSTVTATVVDQAGTLFRNGTYSINFIKPSIPNVGNPVSKTNGIPIDTSVITGPIDSSGNLSEILWRTDKIVPAGWTYAVTVCPQADSHCVTINNVTVTGATNLSATLTAAIGNITVEATKGLPKAYNSAELSNASTGDCFWNLTLEVSLCLSSNGTWKTVGGSSASFFIPIANSAGLGGAHYADVISTSAKIFNSWSIMVLPNGVASAGCPGGSVQFFLTDSTGLSGHNATITLPDGAFSNSGTFSTPLTFQNIPPGGGYQFTLFAGNSHSGCATKATNIAIFLEE